MKPLFQGRSVRLVGLFMVISLISALGLGVLLTQDDSLMDPALAPLFTPAPDQPAGAAQASPPGPLSSLIEAPKLAPTPEAGAAPEAGAIVARQAVPPAEFASDIPPAPLATPAPSAPPVRHTSYLPLALQSYLPPPRQPEPFVDLGLSTTGDWPAALDTASRSKIGLHTLGPNDPAVMEFIRRTHPAVVKSVGSYGWLSEVKQVSPSTVTIARTLEQDFSWVGTLDPKTAAATYINQNLDHYKLNPGVDYWEGWNEFITEGPDAMNWYAQFEAERACQMQALGFHAAVGGFSVGWPRTYPEMALFVPALEAAHRCGGIFDLHEYNRPLLQCGVRSGEANIIPGAPALLVPAGPLTFRYRFWYEGYLKPLGLDDLPLVLSEYGIDAVPAILCPDPDPARGTWKVLADWWQQQGYGSDGIQAYVNQLAWADREMRYDSYVIGATVFTTGAVDSSAAWNGFDLHNVLIPLADYLVSQH